MANLRLSGLLLLIIDLLRLRVGGGLGLRFGRCLGNTVGRRDMWSENSHIPNMPWHDSATND
jgi:hypothetical protein